MKYREILWQFIKKYTFVQLSRWHMFHFDQPRLSPAIWKPAVWQVSNCFLRIVHESVFKSLKLYWLTRFVTSPKIDQSKLCPNLSWHADITTVTSLSWVKMVHHLLKCINFNVYELRVFCICMYVHWLSWRASCLIEAFIVSIPSCTNMSLSSTHSLIAFSMLLSELTIMFEFLFPLLTVASRSLSCLYSYPLFFSTCVLLACCSFPLLTSTWLTFS